MKLEVLHETGVLSVWVSSKPTSLSPNLGCPSKITRRCSKKSHISYVRPESTVSSTSWEGSWLWFRDNQWQVAFKLTLSSFEPHIHGVRNLVYFSFASTNDLSIFFISSISVVSNHQRSHPQERNHWLRCHKRRLRLFQARFRSTLIRGFHQIRRPEHFLLSRKIAGPVDVERGECQPSWMVTFGR
jgi:hypothetical protein